jgi:phospholipase/carboxylesterase
MVLALVGCDRRAEEPGPDPRSAPSVAAAPSTPPAAATASAAAAFGPVQEVAGIRFLVLHVGGAHEGEKLPTIVALHGRGDTAENYAPSFVGLRARARIIVGYGFFATEDHGFQWFDVDHSPDRKPEVFDKGTVEALPRITAFLIELPKKFPMMGKPILTGFSQGGIIAHAIAVHHPELIAIAAPVAGFLPPALAPNGKLEGSLPRVVAYHGDIDPTVSYAWDQMSVQQEKSAGLPAELRLYPNVSHKFGSEELADYLNLLDDVARGLDTGEKK